MWLNERISSADLHYSLTILFLVCPLQQLYFTVIDHIRSDWGTGIRGQVRGMANLPQGNQELLVVKDKVGRPQVSLG